MKIVCCKKCSAKYQLEDDDDISAFECTSCTGELELCNNETQNKAESHTPNNTNIVYCVECGSRYALKDSDNILEYECENCGGPLRYVNEEMNQNLGKMINSQKANGNFSSNNGNQPNSIKSISNRFGNLFSENNSHSLSNENNINENRESPRPTARTRIPTDTQRKFGKEFLVPATNDYGILKEFLKEQFFEGVSQYYGISDNVGIPNGTYRNFATDAEKLDTEDFENEVKAENESLRNSKNIAIIVGSLIFIGSVGEIILFNNGIGIIAIFIGVILISYGLYRAKDKNDEVQKRHQIVRDHLLGLPEDYYVFYDVRIPGSDKGINHLVIGPSGIYEILSKKFDPKSKSIESSLESDNAYEETNALQNAGSFKYTTKLSKFQQDNKIKQESLKLGENLMNFLNNNGIRNCFVEPLVGFVNSDVVVINMPLTDEDLFIDELIHQIEYGSVKLDSETIDKCAILVSRYAVDCTLYDQ